MPMTPIEELKDYLKEMNISLSHKLPGQEHGDPRVDIYTVTDAKGTEQFIVMRQPGENGKYAYSLKIDGKVHPASEAVIIKIFNIVRECCAEQEKRKAAANRQAETDKYFGDVNRYFDKKNIY